jgi:hypothetical protein
MSSFYRQKDEPCPHNFFVQITRALRADRIAVHLGCVRNLGRSAHELGETWMNSVYGVSLEALSMRSGRFMTRHLRKPKWRQP